MPVEWTMASKVKVSSCVPVLQGVKRSAGQGFAEVFDCDLVVEGNVIAYADGGGVDAGGLEGVAPGTKPVQFAE